VSSEDVSNDSVLHLDCFEVCEANRKCIVKPKGGTWYLAFYSLFHRMITEYIAAIHSSFTCEAFPSSTSSEAEDEDWEGFQAQL